LCKALRGKKGMVAFLRINTQKLLKEWETTITQQKLNHLFIPYTKKF